MTTRDRVEVLAEEIHKQYCECYLQRHGKPYWTNGDYSRLDEATKEADRYMARWHLSKLDQHLPSTAPAQEVEIVGTITDNVFYPAPFHYVHGPTEVITLSAHTAVVEAKDRKCEELRGMLADYERIYPPLTQITLTQRNDGLVESIEKTLNVIIPADEFASLTAKNARLKGVVEAAKELCVHRPHEGLEVRNVVNVNPSGVLEFMDKIAALTGEGT